MNQIVIRGEICSALKKANIGGETYTNFTIAVECKNRQTGKPERDFVICEAWGKTVDDIVSRFGRGNSIVVIGELRIHTPDEDLARIVVSEACFTCGSLVRQEGAL